MTSDESIRRLSSAYIAAFENVMGLKPKWSAQHLVRRNTELLQEVAVKDRSVLEVGASDGFLSHYLATVRGAGSVVSLDEYVGHGSDSRGLHINRQLQEMLQDEGVVEIVKADFMDYAPQRKFDLIIFVNVLHHIVGVPKLLSEDQNAFRKCTAVFERCLELLAPSGILLVQEVGRKNLCLLPKYRKMLSNVVRETKQQPGEWGLAMKKAGFSSFKVRYRLPLVLPDYGWLRALCNNRLVSVLTDSSYVIRSAGKP